MATQAIWLSDKDLQSWLGKLIQDTGFVYKISLFRAVEDNLVDVCSKIIEYSSQDKNPSDEDGKTALHHAASNGQLEICRLIVAKVLVKNPTSNLGVTPLHEAAENGHTVICRLIIQNLLDKNPRDNGAKPWAK